MGDPPASVSQLRRIKGRKGCETVNIKHSLVIPCYNEEGNVARFLKAAKTAMEGYTADYELVFVNDGSRDGTQAALRQLYEANRDMHITVIQFSRNFGKEAAMYAGLNAAKGAYVTVIDADMQQRPEVAVEMGRILDAHPDYDMVAAFQAKRKENKMIAWFKKQFYKVINSVTEVQFIPDASDFRTLRRPVVESILALSEYHRFSKGLFSWVGYQVYSIPYDVQDRESGETKWNFRKLMRYALDGIMAYTDLPLKLPLYAGGLFTTIGAALAVALLVLELNSISVGLWWIACLMLFLSGLILTGQGIIGRYLGKVHTQVKQRPIYIAKEVLSYEED